MKKILKIVGLVVLGIIVLLLLIGGVAYYKLTHVKDTHDLRAQIDKLGKEFVEKEKAPGLFVAVVKGGQVYTMGYGTTEIGRTSAPGPYTVFEIGSISKVFTATLTEALVQQGVLKWDERVADALPAGVTMSPADSTLLLHLATHTSGYPRLPEVWVPKLTIDTCDPYSKLTVEDVWKYVASAKDKRKPNFDDYEYSNFGMGLLGEILCAKTGMSYDSLLQKYIGAPLGMLHTTVTDRDSAMMATGYDESGKLTCHWHFPVLAGAGAIRSTGAEMLQFLQLNMHPAGPLKDIVEATHPQVTGIPGGGIAKGWHIDKINSAYMGVDYIMWHNGGTGGFRSYIGYIPEKDCGILLWTNRATDKLDRLAYKMLHKMVFVSFR